MAETLTEKLTNTPEKMRLYQQERVSQELMDLICETMGDQRKAKMLSQQYGDIERLLGWGPGRVMVIFNGKERIRLDDASDILHVLGKSLHFSVEPLET